VAVLPGRSLKSGRGGSPAPAGLLAHGSSPPARPSRAGIRAVACPRKRGGGRTAIRWQLLGQPPTCGL